MSEAKTARGLRELDDIDTVFAALAHATRRHILQVLAARRGSMTAGEVSARFAHSWPTITRHLNVLLDAELISVDQVGRERHYRISKERLGDVLALWLASVGFDVGPKEAGSHEQDEQHGASRADRGGPT